MNRKLISIIIIFTIIQGIFLGTSYSEASSGKVNLSVSSTTGKVGDEVSIDVDLNNNSNFVSGNFVLNYNTQDLEYVSHTEGNVLKTAAMSIVKNNSDTGKIAIGYIADPSSDNKTVQSGNILKIVFKLKDNMNKETELQLECTSLEDEDGTNITTSITNGKIERTESSNNSTGNNNNTSNGSNNNTSNGSNNNTSNGNNNNTSNENNNNSNGSNNNTSNGNNNTSTGNSDNNNQLNNNSQSGTNFPHAGLSENIIFILVCLILISIVLYKQSKYLREIN